ncbi:hypothetical protein C8N35_105102 [Breoghania corrubedonensis]|uniref:Uncharacterized protein n=1 Tax=Breoghania corrubedonensis TaxID=665038 RepID=A0A2T5V8M7_9HYPH|nr:hypothetical protein [Breoghania corrubedonensis]PTW60102.1 hypothetical protein C8N35_105102 [Breoghania corrubedonensis]
MAYTEHDTFHMSLPFSIRPRELTVATAAALVVFFLALFGISFGTAGAGDVVSASPMKSDRHAIGYEDACAGQAWGNWNESCLKALSKRQDLRLAPSRTVEFRDTGRQLSVLQRQPSNS